MKREIKRTINVRDERETENFGLMLAEELKAGDVLCLIGNLGTGKTTLTRYIAKGLDIKERLNSPTFTIVKEYHTGKMPLYHFDVYRVSDYDELFNIGFEEYIFGEGGHKIGLSVIEWADLILDDLPLELEDHLKIIYIYAGDMPEKDDEDETGGRTYQCTF